MKLAALLFTAIALDALTFAAVTSLPGLLAYEQNPVTRTLAGHLGIDGYVLVKLAAGALAALLLVRAGARARTLAAVVALVILVGAASNVWALVQLGA